MAVEENLRKRLYKTTLFTLKIIPAIIALCDILNTLFYLFDVNAEVLSYFGGVSFLTLAFLYLTSYAFNFCEYHRLPLHYVVVTNLLSIVDYYFSIGLSPAVYLIIAGIFILLLIYLHQKENAKRIKKDTSVYNR